VRETTRPADVPLLPALACVIVLVRSDVCVRKRPKFQTYFLNQKLFTLLPDEIHMLCMCHATNHVTTYQRLFVSGASSLWVCHWSIPVTTVQTALSLANAVQVYHLSSRKALQLFLGFICKRVPILHRGRDVGGRIGRVQQQRLRVNCSTLSDRGIIKGRMGLGTHRLSSGQRCWNVGVIKPVKPRAPNALILDHDCQKQLEA